MAEPGFWDDQERSQKIIAEAQGHRRRIQAWSELASAVEDAELMLEMAGEEGDAEAAAEVAAEVEALVPRLEAFEVESLLDGPDDHRNGVFTINSGAGGTDADDWAQMMMRMYMRWFDARGWQADLLDLQPGEEAGIKSVTIQVKGQNAFGYLRAECGVHRLVRISPFDSSARRQTSFASVFAYPEVEGDIKIDIQEGDLRVDTYRASGAGGQHVNKTSSAVRLTHLPTGIVVTCQTERSQLRNRESAMKILASRLYQRHQEEEAKKRQVLEDTKTEIAWGNQIRSYVLHPYSMVKDHRTGHETGNVPAVLDGALDPFVRAYLLSKTQSA
jgi:peptide chain release factor 2